MRKSRQSLGMNAGVFYLTREHAVFYAHYVNVAPDDVRVVLPLKDIVHVRKASYRFVLQQGLLIRCHGVPDYLLVLSKRSETTRVLRMIDSLMMDAKGGSSETLSCPGSDNSFCNSEDNSPFVEFEEFVTKERKDSSEDSIRKVTFAEGEEGGEGEAAAEGEVAGEGEVAEEGEAAEEGEQGSGQSDPVNEHIATPANVGPRPVLVTEERVQPSALVSDIRSKVIQSFRLLEKVSREITLESLFFLLTCLFLLLVSLGLCIVIYLLRLRLSSIASAIAAHEPYIRTT